MNTIELKNQYLEKGYFHLRSYFKSDQLKNLSKISEDILKKSEKGKWNYIKVYREYPIFFGKINLFGVEYPLNNNLNSDTFNEFQKLNYKEKLLEILEWKNFKTPLIRLHTNSNFYNYQGEWHRDHDFYPSPTSVQAIIYLRDEKGYRIVPKDKNHLLKNYDIATNKQESDPDKAFAKLPKKIYDEIECKKGDILIHESGLLHQGFCKKKRLHYHLRHIMYEEAKNLSTKDLFNFSEQLTKDFDLSKIDIPATLKYKEKNLAIRLRRLLTFVLYFFPRVRSIVNNFHKKNKQTIFHSTIWQ